MDTKVPVPQKSKTGGRDSKPKVPTPLKRCCQDPSNIKRLSKSHITVSYKCKVCGKVGVFDLSEVRKAVSIAKAKTEENIEEAKRIIGSKSEDLDNERPERETLPVENTD